jgi:peptidoglycan/xylan/chitin deacetylase (PgdA/CDA1 family)
VLQQAVKVSSAGLDFVRRPEPGVVVLIYHRVGGGSRLEIDLSIPQFDAQMAWLAATGKVVSLETALAVLGPGATAKNEALIVVSFDDGTADFVDHALPVLERYRIPVTLYAATAFIDEGVAFPDDGRPCSWSALRDAVATGLVDIGSHTHRHRLLDRLPDAEIDDELDRSIGLIGEHVGSPPRDFAYPKAVLGSPAAERAVRSRFRSAALAGTRPNRYAHTDPHRLSRSPVQVSDARRWFVRKAAGGMAFEDSLRRRLNRHRYAAATS